MTILRTSSSGPALLLNGKPYLVTASLGGGGGGVVTPPDQTLAITGATGLAGSGATLNGTYANGTPLGMQYSTNNGASWTGATSPTIAGGTFSLNTGTLTAGTYQVLVRDSITLVASLPATLTIAAGGTGTASTLTQNTVIDSYIVRQRDVFAGNPPGWSTTWNRGWGAVTVTVTPGAGAPTSGGLLFAKLYDADSIGATPTAGTGTLLHGAVQVYGAMTAAANQAIRLLTIPAGPFFYYMDLATDAAFTNPVRVAKPFGVGDITIYLTRSISSSIGNQWEYSDANMPADLSVIVPMPLGGVNLPMDGNGAGTLGSATAIRSGSPGSAVKTLHSTGSAEYQRLMISQLGVVQLGFGCPIPGGNMEQFTVGSGYYNVLVNNLAHIESKYRYVYWMGNNGNYSDTQWKRQVQTMYDALKALSSVPIRFQFDGTGGGWLGSDGSHEDWGFSQLAGAAAELEATRADFISHRWYDFNHYFANGHSSMQDRVRQARQWFRNFMAIEPQGGLGPQRGPRVIGGTRSAGSAVLRLGVQHDGGTSLIAHKYEEATPTTTTYSTPTAAELRNYIAVYPAGGSHGRASLVPITGVAIDNATNSVLITLASVPADTAGFTVFLGCDFFTIASNPTPGVMIADDRVDTANSIPYGYPILSTPAGVTVPPPTNSAVVSINTPNTTVAGGLLALTGPSVAGAAPVAGVLVSLNGGAKQTPIALRMRGDNSWQGFIKAPAAGTGHTVAVFRPGQTTADATTAGFATASRATLLGVPGSADPAYASMSSGAVSSLAASYSSLNYGTIFQDAAGTQPVTATQQDVRAWADELGTSSNTLVQTSTNPSSPLVFDFRGVLLRSVSFSTRPGVLGERGAQMPNGRRSLATASVPAVATALTGDFSIFTVFSINYGGALLQLGPIQVGLFFNLLQLVRGADTLRASLASASSFYFRAVFRYRASDGLADITYSGVNSFTTMPQTTVSATFSTAAITPGVLSVNPDWGLACDLKFWSTFLSDADRDAALVYATATVG